MERYWVNDITKATVCPLDYHQLKYIRYYRSDLNAAMARECPFCHGIFIQYKGAELAAKHPNIKISCLGGEERQKCRKLRQKAKEEEKRKEEARERAEHEALIAKKKRFIKEIEDSFETDFLSSEALFNANNTEKLLTPSEFNKLKEDFVANWFANNTPAGEIQPDTSQIAAIAATEKNVEVVARAGSGKTATIVNRFRFLTEHCGVDASTILLLAFNKNAAEELREKIKKLKEQRRIAGMLHVMTFHGLAYSIVNPLEKIIHDDEDKCNYELSRTVQSIIDEMLHNTVWVSKIRSVMLSHFRGNWEAVEAGGYNLSREEQLCYLRSQPRRTLKGEYVKSFGEKAIANILFEHDIEYKYEKSFYWTDGTIYHPDFTVEITDGRQIIIEYFGLAGNREYDRQIQRKREYWRGRNIRLIELYPSELTDGLDLLTSRLLGDLKSCGVSYRRLTEKEIWKRTKERAIDDFTRAMTSFIGRCRKKDLSAEDLAALIQGYKSDLPEENTFLEIASAVYDEYLNTLSKNNLMDFDSLISCAALCIQEGETGFDRRDNCGDLKNLSFIMIDEYQDFSYLFERFLSSIRNACPNAAIFCVGDNWQAINAFAGSDVKYFQQFTKRYPDSCKYKLEANYRSKQNIVSVSSRLMLNKESGNSPKAVRRGDGIVRVAYLSDFVPSPSEQRTYHSDWFTPAVLRLVSHILNRGKQVVFLTRTNKRLPLDFGGRWNFSGSTQERFLESVKSYFPPDKRQYITASTVHRYKGKEKNAVIILDSLAGYYPLIHSTWIFQRVFGDTIKKLVEDERCLYYVALSRARDELYILTTAHEESPFLNELGRLTRLRWNDYAPAGIKVEVCNQNGFGTEPTMAIKDMLAAQKFAFDARNKTWYNYYPSNDFGIHEILNQPWTRKANHVGLKQYNEDGSLEKAYLFVDGKIVQEW